MDQTVLFLAMAACAGVQALFLTNHRYFLRGTFFSAVSGGGGLLAIEALLPSLGLCVTAPTLLVSCVFGVPGCVFLLLIKLICGV